MAQPDNAGTPAEKTFTQAELDAIVRDRLKRERETTATKYADYDQLKASATAAEGDKSKLDQVLQKLGDAEARAAKAEAENTRNGVATAKKLPPWMARRLSGKTKEELEADADEMLAEWKAAGGGPTDDGKDGKEGNGTDGKLAGTATTGTPAAPRGRPTETLRSGAPLTEGKAEETNPMKLAAMVPRN